MQIGRLRRELAGLALPRDTQGRIMLAVDVSSWLGPDAASARDRLFCHVYGRGRSAVQLVPGWPYSFVAALEPGRSSWTAMLDVMRMGPSDDLTQVSAAQVIDVVDRLRTDRVFYLPASARTPGQVGRPAQHGPVIDLDQPDAHPPAALTTSTQTTRYGTALAQAWHAAHQELQRRAGWADHQGQLPTIVGTLIRLVVDRLPGDRNPKRVWLWCSAAGLHTAEVDRVWQSYLRRLDLEHTFRMFKQTLGWTTPRIRDPQATDRWTWLIVVAYTQLRLARGLTADLRRPWERPTAPPARLTPARVRRGFRHLRSRLPVPAGAP